PVPYRRRRDRRSWRDLRRMSAIEPGNRFSWYLNLFLLAKREDDERHECAECSESSYPPDVPDQGKAGNHGKEGVDETGRSVFRHFDRHVRACLRPLTLLCARLLIPEGISLGDVRQYGEVPAWWRRRR